MDNRDPLVNPNIQESQLFPTGASYKNGYKETA